MTVLTLDFGGEAEEKQPARNFKCQGRQAPQSHRAGGYKTNFSLEARGGPPTARKASLLHSVDLELFLPDSALEDGGQGHSAQRSESIPPISGLFFLD